VRTVASDGVWNPVLVLPHEPARDTPDPPGRSPLVVDRAVAHLTARPGVRTVVLVEGDSDRAAVEALAARRGRDLGRDGVAVVAMGGVTNTGHFLERLGPHGLGLAVAGLYDVAEEEDVRRGLDRTGVPGVGEDLAGRGFHVCDRDLEDELIRALGVATVLVAIESVGELPGLRRFQRQPAQRGRPVVDQLRRFIGTRSGRKIRYGRLLVDHLDLDRTPTPLDRLLAAL
jgi:hypothetical protein